jgi:phage tail tape-measure protein
MAIDSVAAFLESIRQNHLLEPTQITEAAQEAVGSVPGSVFTASSGSADACVQVATDTATAYRVDQRHQRDHHGAANY